MKTSKTLSNSELSLFCEQSYHLFKAGIAPSDGMDILLEDATNPAIKNAISIIKENCMMGETFSNSCKMAEVFPDYVVNMIALGEESGHLTSIMKSLSSHYSREEAIANSIRDAIRYPMIMIAMMFLVIVVLVAKVLPIFNQVFIQLGADMTGFAASLLKISDILSHYSLVFLILFILIIGFLLYLTQSKSGKSSMYRLSGKIPFLKSFRDCVAAGRFASGMTLTLSSGLDTFQSLDLVSQLIENEEYEKKIEIAKSALYEGETFAEALKKAKIFSTYYTHMLIIGVRTGAMDQIMNRIADNYEDETEEKIRSLISTLEPTLVIILSLFVGLVLLSVILPLMGVMSMIG